MLWVPAGFSVPWFYLKIPGVIFYIQHLCLLSSCHTAVLDGFNYCSVSFFLMYFPYVSFSMGRLFTPFFLSCFPHFCPFLIIGLPTIRGPAVAAQVPSSCPRSPGLRRLCRHGDRSGTVCPSVLWLHRRRWGVPGVVLLEVIEGWR